MSLNEVGTLGLRPTSRNVLWDVGKLHPNKQYCGILAVDLSMSLIKR